jgi:hypothetical protein
MTIRTRLVLDLSRDDDRADRFALSPVFGSRNTDIEVVVGDRRYATFDAITGIRHLSAHGNTVTITATTPEALTAWTRYLSREGADS